MTTPTTVRFAEDTQTKLGHLAKLTNRSKSYLINQAVEAYLKDRTPYLQALDEAVESIETMPTHKAEDVFSWMKTWGTENERPLKDTKLSPNTNN